MKARLTKVLEGDIEYTALVFMCPGCTAFDGGSGLHILPVNCEQVKVPSWDWDGNLEAPTLSPSILTTLHNGKCHSFLKAGVFQFLGDSSHNLAGQEVPLPDLPDWAH